MNFRYVILGWQSGSNRLQHRQPLQNDVELSLIWDQKYLKMPVLLGQSNMTFTVLAFFCGNSSLEKSRFQMVDVQLCFKVFTPFLFAL